LPSSSPGDHNKMGAYRLIQKLQASSNSGSCQSRRTRMARPNCWSLGRLL
jgi:hypothetical protein